MPQQWKFQGTSSPVRSMDWTEGTFGLDWPGLLGPSVPSGLDWLAERYRRLGLARNLRSRPVQSRTKPVQSGRTGFGLDRQISDHDLLPLLSTPFHCPPLIQVNYFPRIIQPLPEILKPLSAKLRFKFIISDNAVPRPSIVRELLAKGLETGFHKISNGKTFHIEQSNTAVIARGKHSCYKDSLLGLN
jgi:hypothetical protein